MIPIAAGARIWIATGHTDMRKAYFEVVRSSLGRAGSVALTLVRSVLASSNSPLPIIALAAHGGERGQFSDSPPARQALAANGHRAPTPAVSGQHRSLDHIAAAA